MPIASKKVLIDGTIYLDGGIADSVPFQAAIQAGYDKIVVVKTQHCNYRKAADSRKVMALYKALYARQPALYEAVVTRPERYNAQMEEIERLRKDGPLFVIEPDRPVEISRIEKDKGKLRSLYQDGLTQGQAVLPALFSYL